MYDWQAKMGAAAGLLSILCFVPYTIAILRRRTRPNRVTWWTWVVLSLVISITHYYTGATNTIWLPICGGIGQLIIAILSLKYGEGGWSRFDKLCLLGIGISLLLWWRLNSPLVALLCNLIVDFLGALPTLKKSYQEPETESLLTWSLYLLGSTLNLFAIERWSFALGVFPLYIFSINFSIVFLLLRSKTRIQQIIFRKRRLSKIKQRSKRMRFFSRKTL